MSFPILNSFFCYYIVNSLLYFSLEESMFLKQVSLKISTKVNSLTFFKMQYCSCCYLLLEGLKCFVYDLELQKKGYTIFSECTMKFCTTKIKFSQYYYNGINCCKFVYVDLPITRMKIMKKQFQ